MSWVKKYPATINGKIYKNWEEVLNDYGPGFKKLDRNPAYRKFEKYGAPLKAAAVIFKKYDKINPEYYDYLKKLALHKKTIGKPGASLKDAARTFKKYSKNNSPEYYDYYTQLNKLMKYMEDKWGNRSTGLTLSFKIMKQIYGIPKNPNKSKKVSVRKSRKRKVSVRKSRKRKVSVRKSRKRRSPVRKSRKSVRKSSRKRRSVKRVGCRTGWVKNPATGYCWLAKKQGYVRSPLTKRWIKKCIATKVRNLSTNRCRKKSKSKSKSRKRREKSKSKSRRRRKK